MPQKLSEIIVKSKEKIFPAKELLRKSGSGELHKKKKNEKKAFKLLSLHRLRRTPQRQEERMLMNCKSPKKLGKKQLNKIQA